MSKVPKRLKRLRPRPPGKPPRPRPSSPPGRAGAVVNWTEDERAELAKAFARGDREAVVRMMREKTNG